MEYLFPHMEDIADEERLWNGSLPIEFIGFGHNWHSNHNSIIVFTFVVFQYFKHIFISINVTKVVNPWLKEWRLVA